MPPLVNKYIIAIDDTHSILNFLRISLEALGAKFQGAATASGGLALCETSRPDLIVLDLGLPDKEGFDIIPKLKRIDKHGNIPIVVLTVRNTREDRERASSLGACAYITKPFVMNELIEVIQGQLHIVPQPRLKLVEKEKSEAAQSDSIR